jgi:hypothetical protein
MRIKRALLLDRAALIAIGGGLLGASYPAWL